MAYVSISVKPLHLRACHSACGAWQILQKWMDLRLMCSSIENRHIPHGETCVDLIGF